MVRQVLNACIYYQLHKQALTSCMNTKPTIVTAVVMHIVFQKGVMPSFIIRAHVSHSRCSRAYVTMGSAVIAQKGKQISK